MDREELIQRFVSIEFNQFLSYYENSKDLNGDDSRDRRKYDDENLTRFYINLGTMDNLNPAVLIGLINENIEKHNVEIGQIEILKSFSFFELDKNYTDDVLDGFKNAYFNNRSIIVEVTNKSKSGGGNRRKKRTFNSFKGSNKKSDSGSNSRRRVSPGSDGGNRNSGRRRRR
jgi:ATP-dependent RNA helicase DeaD